MVNKKINEQPKAYFKNMVIVHSRLKEYNGQNILGIYCFLKNVKQVLEGNGEIGKDKGLKIIHKIVHSKIA